MTTAYWCVLIAAFLPLLFVGIAKTSKRGYNNKAPRVFEDNLQGYGQRAHWAHLNSFEAFPPFAAAVLIAHQVGANQERIDQLAIAYIVLRLLYGAAYIGNIGPLRSLLWAGAVACWVAMFFTARA
jgi:uncharacterized MAPEG superfamily protein